MTQKVNIAIVSNTMCVGGVEIALIEMLKAFDYQKYQITLFLREPGGEFFPKIDNRVSIRYWGQVSPKRQLFQQIKRLHWLAAARGMLNRLSARQHLDDWAHNEYLAVKSLEIIDDEYYDIIIAYHGATPGVLATALYGLRGKKKVAWIHGKDSFPVGNSRFWANQYFKFHKIACVSASIQSWFNHQYPSTKGISNVVHNLLDSDRIYAQAMKKETHSYAEQNCTLLTVGRLSSDKGQDMIPETARILLNAGYDIHWYIVGDGFLREQIEQKIRQYNVENNVILLGSQKNPYPFMKDCDIYVQTSRCEGWCLTVQEARILCKPIVVTDIPVMHEQIHQTNGLIANGVSSTALAEGIKKLIDSPVLCQQFIQTLMQERSHNHNEIEKICAFLAE